MTIIADSGSTKTSWIDISSGNKVITEGLNPFFTSDSIFTSACTSVAQQLLPSTDSSIFFYGAGCGNEYQRLRVQSLLVKSFGISDVYVETDMLAACRAVSDGSPCIVAIFGTGSNLCLFNGKHIVHQPLSLGFILGDEGSANYIGRMLLSDYLSRRMPMKIIRLFHEFYPMSDAEFVEAIYRKSNPNRFLASLAPFVVSNMDTHYCSSLVTESIRRWHENCLIPLANIAGHDTMVSTYGTIHIVGGYAKAIETSLRRYFQSTEFQIGTILADPIDALALFHNRNQDEV